MDICSILIERRVPQDRGVNRYSFAFLDRVAIATEAKTIGAMIRKHRVEKGLTQVGLAALLGTSPFTINEWEQGHYRPTRFRTQVAKWLGVSVESFFNVTS